MADFTTPVFIAGISTPCSIREEPPAAARVPPPTACGDPPHPRQARRGGGELWWPTLFSEGPLHRPPHCHQGGAGGGGGRAGPRGE